MSRAAYYRSSQNNNSEEYSQIAITDTSNSEELSKNKQDMLDIQDLEAKPIPKPMAILEKLSNETKRYATYSGESQLTKINHAICKLYDSINESNNPWRLRQISGQFIRQSYQCKKIFEQHFAKLPSESINEIIEHHPELLERSDNILVVLAETIEQIIGRDFVIAQPRAITDILYSKKTNTHAKEIDPKQLDDVKNKFLGYVLAHPLIQVKLQEWLENIRYLMDNVKIESSD